MSKFGNRQKASFLKSIPQTSVDSENDTLASKCKFNFAYFDVQPAGQSFEDWHKDDLSALLNKLKEYSKEPLSYWKNNGVLVVYGGFPSKSNLKHPNHVPHQAQWARFRLKSAVRLVGFVLPEQYDRKEHNATKSLFDCNTFYIVFLDAKHQFYLTEKK